jgi:hypothetical protein
LLVSLNAHAGAQSIPMIYRILSAVFILFVSGFYGCATYNLHIAALPPSDYEVTINGKPRGKMPPGGDTIIYAEKISTFSRLLIEIGKDSLSGRVLINSYGAAVDQKNVYIFKTKSDSGKLYDVTFVLDRKYLPVSDTAKGHSESPAAVPDSTTDKGVRGSLEGIKTGGRGQDAYLQQWPFKTKLRSDSLVKAKVRSHLRSLMPVYDHHIIKNPDLGGRILLFMVVNENGELLHAPHIERTTLESNEFTHQIVDSVMKWHFDTLANQTGTDTLLIPLAFGKAGNLVRPVVFDARIEGRESRDLGKMISSYLPEVKKTYLNWVGFKGSVEGIAKVRVNINPPGILDEMTIVWHDDLPGELLDSLQKSIQKAKGRNVYVGEKGVVGTFYVRFEDLSKALMLVMNGRLWMEGSGQYPNYFPNYFPNNFNNIPIRPPFPR